VARYIRKLTRVGSLGPSEERGAGLWVGYDIDGVDGDLSEHGLINVDDWPVEQRAERLREHGVRTFVRVDPETLGIQRTR
jgi:hypothetical protein